MLKIVLVEDEKEAYQIIKSHLEKFFNESGEKYDLKWYREPLKFLEEYKNDCDLILMDIQLPEIDGMEASRRLRTIDANVNLIFVTNMAQFAIKGYEVAALDFVVKPVSYFDFSMKIKRVIKKINNYEDSKIIINSKGDNVYLYVRDIRYVEVLKHKIVYHTINGDYETRGTLSNAEEQLPKKVFVRCNNYCSVNLNFVARIKGYILALTPLKGSSENEEIAISHPRKKAFVQALNDFFRETV